MCIIGGNKSGLLVKLLKARTYYRPSGRKPGPGQRKRPVWLIHFHDLRHGNVVTYIVLPSTATPRRAASSNAAISACTGRLNSPMSMNCVPLIFGNKERAISVALLDVALAMIPWSHIRSINSANALVLISFARSSPRLRVESPTGY